MVKIAQIAKTGLFQSQVQAVGLSLGNKLATGAYWGPTWPGGSSLTGISNKKLGSGYQAKSGKYWNQQLGASMALFDIAAAALKASGNPKNKSAVAALNEQSQRQHAGRKRSTGDPGNKANASRAGNVVATPIVGNQWRKAVAGQGWQAGVRVL